MFDLSRNFLFLGDLIGKFAQGNQVQFSAAQKREGIDPVEIGGFRDPEVGNTPFAQFRHDIFRCFGGTAGSDDPQLCLGKYSGELF